MPTVIVGHQSPDTDCLVSMIAVTKSLRRFYNGSILYEFIPKGTTFKNIEVDSSRAYEVLNGDRIYHVDCGGGSLDDHATSGNKSSLEIISKFMRLGPEWTQIINWVNKADQGELVGGMNLPQMIRGLVRIGKTNHELLAFVETAVDGLLANGKVLVENRDVQVVNGYNLRDIKDCSEPLLATMKSNGVQVGLAIVPDSNHKGMGTKLSHCKVWIIYQQAEGYFAIHTQHDDGIDLVQQGIVQAIRCKESQKRSLVLTQEQLSQTGNVNDMAWFAFTNASNRVISLLHGSAKIVMPKELKTLLTLQEVVDIVLDRVMP